MIKGEIINAPKKINDEIGEGIESNSTRDNLLKNLNLKKQREAS